MMKKFAIILTLCAILLAGCGGAEVPEDTPTPAPTNTPIPPSPTPKPTVTPTPEPTATPTPTPTPEPTLGPPGDGSKVLEILMEAELNEYLAHYYRWAIGISTYILESYLPNHSKIDVHPEFYSLRSESYSTIGDFENSIKDLETAVNLPKQDGPEEQVGRYNNLCWLLAITGEPERALPYCEEAILYIPASDPDTTAMVLDSRGLVYGMLGRIEEAISDFEQVIEVMEDNPNYEDMVEDRIEWLTSLKNGENPFTLEVLDKLRQGEIDPDALPEGEILTEYTHTYFVQFLEQDGFEYLGSDTNELGIPYDFYGAMVGECTIIFGVFGDEDEFVFNRLFLTGCTQEQAETEIGWFGRVMLLADPYQDADDCIPLGELYAWQITEVSALLADDTDVTSEVTVNGISFFGYTSEGDLFIDAGVPD